MQLLPRTQDALAELAASQQLGQGIHAGWQPTAAEAGMVIGHEPFNPVDHSPLDIDPFALDEVATGMPHVPVVLPEKPLSANIVVHHDTESRDDPRVVRAKYNLARMLQASLEHSLPDNDDRSQAYSYVASVTDALPEGRLGRFTELLKTPDDPLQTAQQIGRLCAEGLSFVISDFKRLPLHEVKADYSRAVALKVNHVAELSLPAEAGVISLGNSREVDTDNAQELADFNQQLQQKHDRLIDRLKAAGLATVQVVLNPELDPRTGLDGRSVDRDIAQVVRALKA